MAGVGCRDSGVQCSRCGVTTAGTGHSLCIVDGFLQILLDRGVHFLIQVRLALPDKGVECSLLGLIVEAQEIEMEVIDAAVVACGAYGLETDDGLS